MKNERKEIRYADLFGGVGGFRLGIERAENNILQQNSRREGEESRNITPHKERECDKYSERTKWKSKPICIRTKCVFYNDIDKYAVQTYNKNFNENHEATDIRNIKAEDIPEIDMLCGGFPCQAFSIAGKRRGFEDTRGTLFFEIARIIKAKRPKIVFLENVKGLLNHEKGKTFSTILNTLWELGYDVQWMVLNSKFFGVPQNRERVFIIGSLRGTSRPEILPFKGSSQEIDKQQSRISFPTVFSSQHKIARGMPMIKAVLTPDRVEKRQNGRRFKEDGEPSFTLTGQDIHGVMENTKIRRLTPIECERLQGFSDKWTQEVSDTQRYKQMGNAVTVNVIQAIAERLLK